MPICLRSTYLKLGSESKKVVDETLRALRGIRFAGYLVHSAGELLTRTNS